MSDLRSDLRDGLRPLHDRLDEAVARIDLATPGGLGIFLSGHAQVWGAVRAGSAMPAPLARALDGALAALAADLAVLGRPRPEAPPLAVHADAAAYAFLGAQLGTAVLRQRWLGGSDPLCRAAGRFLSLPGDRVTWQALTARLSAIRADVDAARPVRDGVRQIYIAFSAAMVPDEDHDRDRLPFL